MTLETIQKYSKIYSRGMNNTAVVKKSSMDNDSLTTVDPAMMQTVVSQAQNHVISIRDFPPTSRYLLKNIFGKTIHHSPRAGMKEVISNMRNLFYTQMAIDAKHEETIKLTEYITME